MANADRAEEFGEDVEENNEVEEAEEESAPLLTKKTIHLRAKRRSMNIHAILLGLFVPWVVFVIVVSALSWKIRYTTPLAAFFLVLLALLIVIVFGVFSAWACMEKRRGRMYEPSWYVFIFLTSLFGFIFGGWAGNHIYSNYTLHCYRSSEMTTYSSVNPSMMNGAQLMDAGVISFTPDTKVDLTRWMSFKDRSIYCVAPIVPKSLVATGLSTYDFWAVGTDCCAQTWTSGSLGAKSYHCGDFNKKNASTGLRLMSDDTRPFFRLAVQQAEAAYNIRATHPLFFHWKDMSGDGGDDAGVGGGCSGSGGYSRQYNEGQSFFKRVICTDFVLQLFLVLVVCIAFSKIGYY